ncbi:peptide chain release factor 3 [Fimbriimonas ginsengisoli]|uniref:Peptide chain release factor 3 n=1 Tax=Fimbriimonas ginsengisoli Gsoil 348 TaxID=661478 RepID=A0A068NRL4_FIMGI|nr:peptide chain release factor 3 [Fimbriimonas ginsengisoli]AIE85410.1 Peptide chain release factor 3 [Fimbriimonas ginsengisoli Gsoil 348]
MSQITDQTARRRTFAIISHPDAGKTTLTEKLLLYGGAIQLAGSVKARRNQRKATSDWMELEKERGISVTSTVLQFEYKDHVLNLLDTPGHNDFSADTYRTLTAADSAVMLIDNAKGVETQTKKLFAVCRDRGIPIFTFVNKMDHPGRGPLALLTEVEEVLGIASVPVNWPIGQGSDFKGVYDRETKKVHLYSRTAHGATKAELEVLNLDDPRITDVIGADLYQTLLDDIDLLDIAGEGLELEKVARGELTPVFFGSALTNFGVELFLSRFMDIAPAPTVRVADKGPVPAEGPFSGFVFKIQANMDPNHRDRIAFLRVVSGRFEKDMEAAHTRTGKKLRLSRPQRLFAQDRETVEEAYPGDIVGLTNPGAFQLGDTLSSGEIIRFDEVPSFAPEVFSFIRNDDVGRLKHFEKGIQQLCEEGLVDLFWDRRSARREPILGAVGKLQFEVVQHRLRSEYGVESGLEPLGFEVIRWVEGDPVELRSVYWGSNARLVEDDFGNAVVLIMSAWNLQYLEDQNPKLQFFKSRNELDRSRTAERTVRK